MPRQLRSLFSLITLAGFALSGCGNRNPEPAKRPPPTVTVATPVHRPLNIYSEYVGQIASPQTVELRARVDGFVKEIVFKDGTIVERDQLLVIIDPQPYEVALQSAQAQLQVAEAALEQAKNVKDIQVDKANVYKAAATLTNAQQQVKDNQTAYSKGAVPREALDNAITAEKQDEAALEVAKQTLAQAETDYKTRVAQAQAQVAVARAAVAAAKLNLSYTRVTAPITGRIGLANVHIGSLVLAAQGTLLATMSQTDPIWVYFAVSEREEFELHKLHEEKKIGGIGEVPAQLILEDASVYPHTGVINFAGRALDPGTGTLTLRAEFPNPDQFLRPGNFARVKILINSEPDVLMIPEAALGSDQAGNYVFIINAQNAVERRAVTSGAKDNGYLEVKNGLKGDERVIVNGLQRVRPGMQVTPIPDSSTGQGRAPIETSSPQTHPGSPR
jgi:RND family efflux transporter MFP subunit